MIIFKSNYDTFVATKHRPPVLLTVCIILLACICSGCQENKNIAIKPEWVTFVDPELAFTIDYPQSWTAISLQEGLHGDTEIVAIIVAPKPAFPVVLIAQKQQQEADISSVVNWGKDRIDQFYDDYQLEDILSVTVSDQQALSMLYTADKNTSLPIRSNDIYVVHDDIMMIITFRDTEASFGQTTGTFDTMLASFKFK